MELVGGTSLETSETGARYRAVIDAMVDALIFIDEHGVIREVNPATLRLFGYERGELLGRNVRMLMNPPEREEHDGYIDHYRTTREARIIGIGREVTARRKDGEVFDVDLAVGEVHQSGGFVGIVRDITRRKRAESRLQESEARANRATSDALSMERLSARIARRLALLIDSLPALVSYVNADGRYEFVNKSYMEWFGLKREEIVGRSLRELLGDEAMKRIQPRMDAVLAGQSVSYEDEVTYKHGGTRYVHASYVPEIATDGTVQGFYALVTDISRRRQLEGRLREIEKMAAIGHLAAGLSHDMANIILPLQVAVEALKSASDPEKMQRAVENIQACTAELTTLVRGVRQVAKSGKRAGSPEVIDLADWWDRTKRLLRASISKRVRLKAEFPADVLRLRVEEPELTRAMLNLVVNASDAIEELARDGEVVVWARCSGEDESWIEMGVRDNGPGISPELSRKIFEPFFTTKHRETSTGLGMSIIKGFVEHAAGTIRVESEPGGGANIILKLPRAPAGSSAAAVPSIQS